MGEAWKRKPGRSCVMLFGKKNRRRVLGRRLPYSFADVVFKKTFPKSLDTLPIRLSLSRDPSRHQCPFRADAPGAGCNCGSLAGSAAATVDMDDVHHCFGDTFGLQIMTAGKRRAALMDAFEKLLSDLLERRVVDFDSAAAHHAADLMAVRQREGHSGELRDTMIAGIVLASRGVLATQNVSHFQEISSSVVNPWVS